MPESVTVLVTAYHKQPSWNLPTSLRSGLEEAFPDVRWLHHPDWNDGFGEELTTADVLFGWHLPREAFPRARSLRWVQSLSTGVRRLLYPEMIQSEVMVTSARGVHAPYLAEQIMAWILAHYRRLPELYRAREQKCWDQEGLLRHRMPDSLMGKQVVVVGFGAGGRELARRLAPFGAVVTGVRTRPQPEPGVERMVGPDEVDALLPQADVVVNLLPNTPTTRGFFSAGRFERFRQDALFINVGRGSTVDEEALAARLIAGKLGGAALDVFHREPLPEDSPLWLTPHTQLAPHIAGVAGMPLWERLVALFTENLTRFQTGKPLNNLVDKTRGY